MRAQLCTFFIMNKEGNHSAPWRECVLQWSYIDRTIAQLCEVVRKSDWIQWGLILRSGVSVFWTTLKVKFPFIIRNSKETCWNQMLMEWALPEFTALPIWGWTEHGCGSWYFNEADFARFKYPYKFPLVYGGFLQRNREVPVCIKVAPHAHWSCRSIPKLAR